MKVGKSNFLTIGITLPGSFVDVMKEVDIISAMLESNAIDLFHIRKPDSTADYTRKLIEGIDRQLHNRLILHSHYVIYDEFEFGGWHYKPSCLQELPKQKSEFPTQILSRSCHSKEELEADSEPFTYSFLSPIFDSISKEGYASNFSLDDDELKNLNSRFPVIALGGVTPDKFTNLFDMKFAGAALLGYLWSPNLSTDEIIRNLKKICCSL